MEYNMDFFSTVVWDVEFGKHSYNDAMHLTDRLKDTHLMTDFVDMSDCSTGTGCFSVAFRNIVNCFQRQVMRPAPKSMFAQSTGTQSDRLII